MIFISFHHNFIFSSQEQHQAPQISVVRVSLSSLPEQCQVPMALISEFLIALKIEPHQVDGQMYITAQELKLLEQLIKRIEISWGYAPRCWLSDKSRIC